MYCKLTIRITHELALEMKREARRLGVSMAEVARLRLAEFQVQEKQNSEAKPKQERDSMLIENNLFLRELAFERNSQIIDRVQRKMRRQFPNYGGLE